MLKTVSECIGEKAGGIEFVAKDGQKHKVKPVTLQMMGQYEKWLESKAIRVIVEQKDILGESFSSALSAISSDIVSGRYAFGSKACQDALASISGMVALTGLMLNIDEIRAKYLLMNEAEDLKAVMDIVIKESMPEAPERP